MFKFVVLLSAVSLISGLPFKVYENSESNIIRLEKLGLKDLAEELSGQFEGDMVLNDEQMANIVYKNGLIADKYRWKNNTVTYYINEEHFNEDQVKYIRRGLDELERVTCLKFVPKTKTDEVTDWVNVTGTFSGCFSMVGRQGGVQQLNFQPYALETGCFRLATIQHEFIHAIGFYHMQSSTDRDQYVRIAFENIQSGTEHNFNIYGSDRITHFGIKYDYGSIMHYGPTAFSKNGQPTIIPSDPDAEIGQRLVISVSDIKRIKKMYNC